MRTLTIKRRKKFVACLGSMKVYITDAENGDLTINGENCRRLGKLKNGEEATFEIPENEARVYVIADKVSRNYCNDFKTVPAGEENVYMEGQNKYNPGAGNAFRFDGGEADPSIIANRKKGNRIGWVILICCFIIGIAAGFFAARSDVSTDGGSSGKAKDFTCGAMTITLTNKFEEEAGDDENYNAMYYTDDLAITVLQEVDAYGLDLTTKEYCELIKSVYTFESVGEITTTDNYSTFFYTQIIEGETYGYYLYSFKNDGIYWMITFMVVGDSGELEDVIENYAATIRFD